MQDVGILEGSLYRLSISFVPGSDEVVISQSLPILN